MQNAIQRLYFGSQASPVAASELRDGSYQLAGFGGMDTSSSIAYNADTSAMITALEAMVGIGPGDAAVTPEANGATIEFVNALANTPIELLVAGSITLKQRAS